MDGHGRHTLRRARRLDHVPRRRTARVHESDVARQTVRVKREKLRHSAENELVDAHVILNRHQGEFDQTR